MVVFFAITFAFVAFATFAKSVFVCVGGVKLRIMCVIRYLSELIY